MTDVQLLTITPTLLAILGSVWAAEEFKGTRVELKPGFKDFLRILSDNQGAYLIVGGYAVMKYTEPFYTKVQRTPRRLSKL
jgi:hypothetical protein